MTFLEDILAHKLLEIAQLDEAELRRKALDAPAPRPFLLPYAHSNGNEPDIRHVRLIAELKRASPSRGLLAPHLDLSELAAIYAANGAAAISVLTDARFFLGSLDTLRALRAAAISPPLLRKDFILSPAQLYETRAAGADAVLLIAAALEDDDLPTDTPAPAAAAPTRDAAVPRLPANANNPSGQGARNGTASLRDLHALALELGLSPLVEVHSLPELERVLRLPGLRWVGINNRDLHSFNVTLETTAALRPRIAPGVGVVSESGIVTAADVQRLAAIGIDAVLVGEALVTAADIGAKVRELSGVVCAG